MDFSQMETKKLNALLATANDEDKQAIAAELAARGEQAEITNDDQLSPEENAAIEAAEKNGGLNPLYAGKKPKMTDEERAALAAELREHINHRCQAVPFNSGNWVDGYVVGIAEDKRSNNVLYAIKTDDGRRIVKVHDSNLVRILDEVITPEKGRGRKKAEGQTAAGAWAQEEINAEIEKVIKNVGKVITFFKRAANNGEEREKINGRIIAISPDKRSQSLLYRIAVIDENGHQKIMHKTVTAEGLKIAEDFDGDDSAIFNERYQKRHDAAIARASITPQDRVFKCEESVKSAEERLRKAQEELEAKKSQLESARKELDEYLLA